MTEEPPPQPLSRRRKWLRRFGALLLIAAVAFFPLPLRDNDYASLIVRDVQRYHDGKSLLIKHRNTVGYGYGRLYSDPDWTWHYYSDTNLDLSALRAAGFNEMTKTELKALDWETWYDDGNFLFEIRNTNYWDRNSDDGLRLNAHWGHNGQGYRVYAYKCLLGTFSLYWPEWIT